jgi:hypothetical protein
MTQSLIKLVTIDHAAADGALLIMVFHNFVAGSANNVLDYGVDNFVDLLAYLNAKGFKSLTMAEALALGGGRDLAVRRATKTWDPPSVGAAASTTTTVTVPGAMIGDPVVVAHGGAVIGAGVTLTGEVTAVDTVTVTLTNNSASAVDRASATLKVSVLP